MDDNKNTGLKSRRWFLSLFANRNAKPTEDEMVKMLTPDGKLVTISKAVLEAASKKKKASNQDIYNWMDNPSK
ncbi:MAG: hypothetical protein U0X40_01395 [Ferruginibacter sp.]